MPHPETPNVQPSLPLVLAERYQLGDVIDQGGHGIVFRAHDLKRNRPVAVKMLNSRASRDPQFIERMRREQRALSDLEGTQAVKVLGFCTASLGAPCIVMELLEGKNLEHFLEEREARTETLDALRLIELLEPVVDTLEAAHHIGIVHRDIKPANIFVLRAGGVRLLDFGLARTKSDNALTDAGQVMGSPSYIAPEVWSGRPELVGKGADIYSLGAVVFRALGGTVPFATEDLLRKFELTTKAPRPSLLALRADLPDTVDAWVECALAIDPEKRFSSVRDLWKALRMVFRLPADRPLKAMWRTATTMVRKLRTGVRDYVEERTTPVPGEVKEPSKANSEPPTGSRALAQSTPPMAPTPPADKPRRKKPPLPSRQAIKQEITLELSDVHLETIADESTTPATPPLQLAEPEHRGNVEAAKDSRRVDKEDPQQGARLEGHQARPLKLPTAPSGPSGPFAPRQGKERGPLRRETLR